MPHNSDNISPHMENIAAKSPPVDSSPETSDNLFMGMHELSFEALPSLGSAYMHSLWAGSRRALKEDTKIPQMTVTTGEVLVDQTQLDAFSALFNLPQSNILPVTFPQLMIAGVHGRMLLHKKFPLPPLGVIHRESRFKQLAPIPISERFHFECRFLPPRWVRWGLELGIETDLRVGDDLLWQSEFSMLWRGKKKDRSKPKKMERQETDANKMEIIGEQWELASDLGRRYAAVSGDYNPIHLHPLSAKLFGFERPIIHGMWSISKSIALLNPILEKHQRFDVTATMKRPILLPGKVDFRQQENELGIEFLLQNPDNKKSFLAGLINHLS